MNLLTYKDKIIEYTYYLKDNKKIKHRFCRGWNKDGQLSYEENYKDGKYHGLCRGWCKNNYEYNYKDGRYNGLFKRWYKNGQLECIYNYKDDKKHGFCKEWYKDGRLRSKYYHWEDIKYKSKEAYKDSLIANKNW